MKIYIIAFILMWINSFSSLAQITYAVKGTVIDTSSNIPMVNATITVVNSKDSTLVKFTRVRSDGTFSLNILSRGKFILLVGYPDYADYIEDFYIDSPKKQCDFGTIKMVLKSKLLEEVIVKGIAKIAIKGDTTEFNATAFNILPNAKVEDLLKQLPGIQINQNGKITAQGKTVDNVLVDGEEFFGDDPTLVTRNIHADMVDIVQLYDKKSEKAVLTGMNDGIKSKTINITLKEDKKNGYFGKLDAGAANKGYYQAQAMFNYFKGDMKSSVYGNLGNTNKTGLNPGDNNKYGINMERSDNGAIVMDGTKDDDLDSYSGKYNGEGNPITRSSGLHFNTKWNEGKQTVNINYKLGSINVVGTKNELAQNNLPEGLINSVSSQEFDNLTTRNKLDAIYTARLNPQLDLKLTINGTKKNMESENSYLSSSRSGLGNTLNHTKRSLHNDGNQDLFDGGLFLTRKFRKAGRFASLGVWQSLNQNKTSGFLRTNIEYFDPSSNLDSIQTIDQYKTNDIRSSLFNFDITYNEPVSKTFFVLVDYGIMLNNSSADRKTFQQSGDGRYNVLDERFSNEYNFDQIANHTGILMAYVKGKTLFNFGTKISRVIFKQVDLYNSMVYKRNFFYWNPQATYRYSITPQKSLRLNFTGNTAQPTMDQLQPVRINNDPLNIVLGNPTLSPSFKGNFNLNYESYKLLNDQTISINASYAFTSNPIVNTVMTETSGRNTYQYTNLLDKIPFSYNLNGLWMQTIKKPDIQIGLDIGVNGNTYYSFINNVLNYSQLNTYAIKVSGSKSNQNNEINLTAGPEYITGQSSLQEQINNNGWGVNSNISFSIQLPVKFKIISSSDYTFRQKTQSFNQNFNRLIWNMKINKKLLKSENLVLSFSGNDILNQNAGFNRSVFNNMIIQNTYSTIRRYFMLSLVYDFDKMGLSQTVR